MTRALHMMRYLLTLVLLVASIAAQTITLTNVGGEQTRWVNVSIPRDVSRKLGDSARLVGADGVAYRGPAIGNEADVWHVRCALRAGGSVSAVLQPDSDRAHDVTGFRAAPSVALDPEALPPVVVVRLPDVDEDIRLVPNRIEPEHVGYASITWKVTSKPQLGLHLVSYVTTYNDQDVVDVEMTLTWSDPTTEALTLDIEGIWIETRDYFALDFRVRHGFVAPFYAGGVWFQPIYSPGQGQSRLGDAEQLAFTGQLLCARAISPVADLEDADRRIRNLIGAAVGRVYGVSHDWAGRWGAFDVLPEKPARPEPITYPRFASLLTQVAGYDVERPLSLAKDAGRTGDQMPFGQSKGYEAVVLHDPRWIQQARYSESLYMRGIHHREVDGSRVLSEDHPECQTWNMRPDWRNSSDMLGKPDAPTPWALRSGVLRFGGIDDQHRVDNLETASYALTGSYILRDALLDAVEADRMQVPGRMGAPRAVGRLNRTWAHYLELLPPEGRERLLERAYARLVVTYRQWRGGRVGGPVRILSPVTDARVITDPDGKPVEAWMVWQESIGCTGLYALYRKTGWQEAYVMAKALARTVTRYGVWNDGTRWRVATAVRYLPDGQPVPYGQYGQRGITTEGGISSSWMLPALKVMIALDPDGADGARAAEALDGLRPDGPESWRDAEWMAIR